LSLPEIVAVVVAGVVLAAVVSWIAVRSALHAARRNRDEPST
jgi:hypothetical protein